MNLDDLLKKLDFVLKPRNIKLLWVQPDPYLEDWLVIGYKRNGHANWVSTPEEGLDDLALLDGIADCMDMDLKELEAMGHGSTR